MPTRHGRDGFFWKIRGKKWVKKVIATTYFVGLEVGTHQQSMLVGSYKFCRSLAEALDKGCRGVHGRPWRRTVNGDLAKIEYENCKNKANLIKND